MTRDTVDGACNDPQPWNWRSACQLDPGHEGAHRTRSSRRRFDWSRPDEPRGWDLSWPGEGGPVTHVAALSAESYVPERATPTGAEE